jgi:NO-binding membrane sensor protein with MHYT domain
MGWHILTALAAGVAIWCTHFVAMLGYHVGVPVGFDPVLTIVSLAFAVFGATAGFAVAQRRYLGRFTSAIGGAIVGLAIAAMHYTGMIAYRVQGRVSWDKYYLVASIVLAVALSAAALHCAAFTPPRPRSHGGPARVRHRLPSLAHGMTAFRVKAMAIDGSFSTPKRCRPSASPSPAWRSSS